MCTLNVRGKKANLSRNVITASTIVDLIWFHYYVNSQSNGELHDYLPMHPNLLRDWTFHFRISREWYGSLSNSKRQTCWIHIQLFQGIHLTLHSSHTKYPTRNQTGQACLLYHYQLLILDEWNSKLNLCNTDFVSEMSS